MAKGKTQTYYDNNPAANKKRLKQQAAYQKQDHVLAKRVALKRENRRRGTDGNHDHKDVSHRTDGSTVLEPERENRKRNRSKMKIA